MIIFVVAGVAVGTYRYLGSSVQPALSRLLRLLPVEIIVPADDGPSPLELKAESERTVWEQVAVGAREQARARATYDASYQAIAYPGGDVPQDRGACTDVVVRAFRRAGIDLQKLIHEDMKRNFRLYPQLWGLSGPDPNIDHRRTQNQMTFFRRFGKSLPLSVEGDALAAWRPGDIVYWQFPNGGQHTGIISDRVNRDGLPLVIHNAWICQEEDVLTRWEIIGHFRYPAQ